MSIPWPISKRLLEGDGSHCETDYKAPVKQAYRQVSNPLETEKFAFKIKAAPCTTFTLKVNILPFQFVLHFVL